VAAAGWETVSSPMDEQLQHVALPKLYGAPAYARPAVAVAHTPRPLDPDDLPIVADMTAEEMDLVASLPAADGRVPSTPGGAVATADHSTDAPLRPRSFSIRSFADRIRRPRP
jgi:hypothetical protein